MKYESRLRGLIPGIFALVCAAGCFAADRFPPVSELPARADFPDPLVMLDGRRVTTAEQWRNERRPELMASFQHYMYGALPPRPGEVAGTVTHEDRAALGGKATLKEITITLGSSKQSPIYLRRHSQRKRP